ncbi:MAG: glycosyltransferase family 2 protein [Candidatus Omnitrophica bacterium]|nr:glycosyltransferase family 2 protein [Candidatus Omnitrophota bacterium]
MGREPLVSVIILNYNGKHLLGVCLDSVMAQSYPGLEMIVVDNGSGDASAEFVRNNYATVKVLANGSNLGYVKAANQGIRCSAGEFVVVLNNDTRVDPFWVERLVRAARTDHSIGICASKQLNFFNPNIIDSAGIMLLRGGYARDRGRGEADRGQYDTAGEIFGAAGASAFYRRSMLDEIGIFDEDYFAYCEEFDLCFRAQLAGWKCVFVPDALVYHMSGQTRAARDERFLVYYVERNRLWTLIKDYPVRLFLLHWPFLLKYEIDILMRFVGRYEKEVFFARLDALRLLPRMLARRAAIQRRRRIRISRLRAYIDRERGLS